MEKRDYAREYGVRLRQIRMAKGISQQQLADMIGCTPQAISKWEKDGVQNVNNVQQLSNALGQDITADQIDQEGAIGEIGKEILNILIQNDGYAEFEAILGSLFGMSHDRVSNEIFKLERIGTVIREQYSNFCGIACDGVMITAKGLVAFKNSNSLLYAQTYPEVKTAEMLMTDGSHSLQEIVDRDEIARILWNLEEVCSYRLDYLFYLKINFRSSFPGMSDHSLLYLDSGIRDMVSGISCFVDILMRMIREITDDEIDLAFCYYDEKDEFEIIAEDVLGLDQASIDAYRYISGRLEGIDSVRDMVVDEMERNIETISYEEEIELETNLQRQSGEIFFKNLPDPVKHKCADWFSKEEVLAYLDRGYNATSYDPRYVEHIDNSIHRIWELNPETLRYYYMFPTQWEDNGLAQAIRDKFGVPPMPEMSDKNI